MLQKKYLFLRTQTVVGMHFVVDSTWSSEIHPHLAHHHYYYFFFIRADFSPLYLLMGTFVYEAVLKS